MAGSGAGSGAWPLAGDFRGGRRGNGRAKAVPSVPLSLAGRESKFVLPRLTLESGRSPALGGGILLTEAAQLLRAKVDAKNDISETGSCCRERSGSG
jgi:hypothetical protein